MGKCRTRKEIDDDLDRSITSLRDLVGDVTEDEARQIIEDSAVMNRREARAIRRERIVRAVRELVADGLAFGAACIRVGVSTGDYLVWSGDGSRGKGDHEQRQPG